MIISVKQTASNTAQTYEVFIDGVYMYSGSLGTFHRFQPIVLKDKNNIPIMHGQSGAPKWMIPMDWLLGGCAAAQKWMITDSTGAAGSIVFTHQSAAEEKYTIAFPAEKELDAYVAVNGDFEYVSLFYGDRQIALMELYLTAVDYCYTYKMYVLEEFAGWKAALSFFVLYYANQRHTKRFHMSKGTFRTKYWALPWHRGRYDPAWRETHFPDENYFGKIHVFNS